MKIRFRLLPAMVALLLLMSCVLSGCTQQEQKEESKTLNLFTWDGYISAEVIQQFTDETGITVNFLNFSSNEEMLAKLQAANGGDYDVVLASDYVLDTARLITEGGDGAPLMQKLDKAKIPNFSNIDPTYQSNYYDPNNEYVVPYVAGSPLIVYDPSRVDIEITGYEDLWDESLRDSVVVMDDFRNVMGIVFKTMGHSLNVTDPEIVDASREKLFALKPNIRAFDYDTPHTLMISGETTVGYMFTPFVALTLMERPDFKVVYPKEGLGYGVDGLFIPANAPNPDNAHAFLNFLLRGDISAQCSEEQLYMNCNTAAREYLSEDYYNNESLYVPEQYLQGAEFMMDVGDIATRYLEIWSEFKQQ